MLDENIHINKHINIRNRKGLYMIYFDSMNLAECKTDDELIELLQFIDNELAGSKIQLYKMKRIINKFSTCKKIKNVLQ